MARSPRGVKLIPSERSTAMAPMTANIHSGKKGDVVVVSGHRVGERERLGEILEVLGSAEHVHYRVRWDDGVESIFYPGSDATIRPSTGRHARRSS
jgi:rRNA processing protein Gar1